MDWAVESEIHVLSLSCDYLMHGVMSTAALHMAYMHPEQREFYENRATQHQNLALSPFRHEMAHINPESCHRVFAFSLLLLVSQYASSRRPDFLLPSPDVTERLTSWIFCLRGCVSIIEQAKTHIKSGPLGGIIRDPSYERVHAALEHDEDQIPIDDDDCQVSRLLPASPHRDDFVSNERLLTSSGTES
jgi:hypothetical protein